jgi:hypothetical protein
MIVNLQKIWELLISLNFVEKWTYVILLLNQFFMLHLKLLAIYDCTEFLEILNVLPQYYNDNTSRFKEMSKGIVKGLVRALLSNLQ